MRMRKKKHGAERMEACGDLILHSAEDLAAQSVHLEIGCGKGAFITECAKRNPAIQFVALEKISDVLLLAAERVRAEGLTNVRFLNDDAKNIPQYFTKGQVERIYLNFSDPWPKKGYAKRRLTHESYLALYRQVLSDTGSIFFKTDNKNLFDFSLSELDRCGFRLKNITYDLHHSPQRKENIMTEYEKNFSEKGFAINRVEAYVDPSFQWDQSMTSSGYAKADDALIASLRKKTDKRIQTIRETPNMTVSEQAVYYVSETGNDALDGLSPETAWASLAKASTVTGPAAVRFERGGIFRGQLKAQPGVTYTAYGEGEKPKIVGSPENGADALKWKQTADDPTVWVYETVFHEDVGLLVFNEGERHGVKVVLQAKDADAAVTSDKHTGNCVNMTWGNPFRDYHDLLYDLDFWHDDADRRIYLKSRENPGKRFSSIEFNVAHNVIAVGGACDVTIDNLCVKYGGCHGVGAGTVRNLTVRNCEFGWIGGAIQYIRNNRTVRFGNAVEIYGGCDTYSVTDCYIYQVYDAGITQQFGLSDGDRQLGYTYFQKNMTYARNVIEYCNYSIEYFLSGVPEQNPSRMENFLIEDNYMWYAGTGVSEQRPDLGNGCHIKSWSTSNRAIHYEIRNNVFVDTKDIMIHISSNQRNPDGSDSMPILSGNMFVCREDGRLGSCAMDDFTWMPYDRKILSYLGKKTHGDTFCFLSPDTVTQIGGAPVSKASSERPRDFASWQISHAL